MDRQQFDVAFIFDERDTIAMLRQKYCVSELGELTTALSR